MTSVEPRTLFDLLALEEIDVNLYRANAVFGDRYSLYGGQVAAQALRAAGRTVEADRLPHSLHGYFLRAGNAARPTVFQVYRDRDGRSFSARRVVALQEGKVIFNMSASFHVREAGMDDQESHIPDVPEPAHERAFDLPRLFSFEGSTVPQPYPEGRMPTRFWARCTLPLGDNPLLHASVLTYLSDLSTGLIPFDNDEYGPSASLDHAVWFHRDIVADDWLLTDLVPHSSSAGRGWYTGSLFDRSGTLVASLAQEALVRRKR